MTASCKSCGESTVEEDCNNGQVTLVCTSCGTVVEEGALVSHGLDGFQHHSSSSKGIYLNVINAPKAITNCCGFERNPYGKKEGLWVLENLHNVFKLSEDMHYDAKALFIQAYSNPCFKLRENNFKKYLAGSCVYSIMRKHGWPISVNNVCWAIGCSKDQLGGAMSMLTKHLNIQFQAPPIEELLENFVGKMELGNDKETIVEKAKEILQLIGDCWLVSGRSQRLIILTAIHIAWQSLHPSHLGISATQFCQTIGVISSRQVSKCRREIINAVMKLAHCVPWIDVGMVNPKNCMRFLDDVLRFRRTLLRDMAASLDQSKSTIEVFRKQPKVNRKSEPFNPELSLEVDEAEIDSYIKSDKEIELSKMVVECLTE